MISTGSVSCGTTGSRKQLLLVSSMPLSSTSMNTLETQEGEGLHPTSTIPTAPSPSSSQQHHHHHHHHHHDHPNSTITITITMTIPTAPSPSPSPSQQHHHHHHHHHCSTITIQRQQITLAPPCCSIVVSLPCPCALDHCLPSPSLTG